MSGRLPSLNSSGNGTNNKPAVSGGSAGGAKPGLKFKPKMVVRKSKEERDAELELQKKKEEEKAQKLNRHNDKNRYSKKPVGANNGKRVPRYLQNTTVVSSGPLAAGNFASGGSAGGSRGVSFGASFSSGSNSTSGGSVIKELMGNSKMTASILDSKDDEDDDDESDDEFAYKKSSKTSGVADEDDEIPMKVSKNRDGVIRINMSKEYKIHDIISDDEDDQDEEEEEAESNINVNDGDVDMDKLDNGENSEDTGDSKEVKQDLSYLFPVRPVRVKHEDVELARAGLQDSFSLPGSKEPTPGLVKSEESADSENNGLSELENQERLLMRKKQEDLQTKIKNMKLDKDFHSVNAEESMEEIKTMVKDYQYLKRKLIKVHNQDRQFIAIQLPHKLPFDLDPVNANANANANANGVQEKDLQGNIGQLRVHKSGKITMKIGKIIMDVSKGSETSFIQDVVAVDLAEEEETVEHLGQVAGKIVATPRI